jgi:hypothetical protein
VKALAFAALLFAAPLSAQQVGRIDFRNGVLWVYRDSGQAILQVSNTTRTRGYKNKISGIEARAIWMLARGTPPVLEQEVPFTQAWGTIRYKYSAAGVTVTVTNKPQLGYFQPLPMLSVEQARTVTDWLIYAADGYAVPEQVMDLR